MELQGFLDDVVISYYMWSLKEQCSLHYAFKRVVMQIMAICFLRVVVYKK